MLKDIKQIDKFKAYYKAGLSNDGEKCFFSVTFNNELQEILKNVIIKTQTETLNLNDETETTNRYKVKTAILTSIESRYRTSLFIKELVDNGKFIFYFSNVPLRKSFQLDFIEALNSFIRVIQNVEMEMSIAYKIKPSE